MVDEAPPPDWKNEVNRKLAAYRERRRDANADVQIADPPTPLPMRNGPGGDFYRPGIDRQAAERLARAAERVDTPNLDEDGNLSELTTRRRTAADWRRVEREQPPPAASAQAGRLPSMRTQTDAPPQQSTPRPPAPARHAAESNDSPGAVPVAPLSERIAAGLFDLALVVLALGIFVGLLWAVESELFATAESLRLIGGAFFLLLCFYWVFYVAFLGETAGMSWMGLRVLNLDGDAPSPRQLRTRAFGTILSTVAAGLGFAWAALDIERLSWHDRMSKTFVARASEAAEHTPRSHKSSGDFVNAF